MAHKVTSPLSGNHVYRSPFRADNNTVTEPIAIVFILGPARSGTSLLYRLLALHPEVAFISNWNSRFPRVAAVGALQRATRSSRSLRRQWFRPDGNAYVYGRTRPLSERLVPAPVEGEPVFALAGINEDGTTRSPDAVDALRNQIARISRYTGGTFFVNKRVANNRRIALIHRAFPEAHFITITRDGRAVALSLSRVNWWQDSTVWWAGETPTEWAGRGNDPWELCAGNWVHEIDAIDEGLSDIPKEQQTTITYEALVADPCEQLTRVAESIGLPLDDSWLDEVGSVPLPANDHWRTELSDSVVRTITDVQRTTLQRLGYIVDES